MKQACSAEQVVNWLLEGDDYVEQIYECLMQEVYPHIKRFLNGDEQHATTVFHEMIIKLLELADKGKLTFKGKEAFFGLCKQIWRWMGLKLIKDKKLGPIEGIEIPAENMIEELEEEMEKKRKLRICFEKLDKRCQEILKAKASGEPFKEMAEWMQDSVTALRMKSSRCLKKLEKCMKAV